MAFTDDSKTKTDLDPWPVILACLLGLDSYKIPDIIDVSGMVVDWALTERENYSHKLRKAAYRVRISRAHEALNEDDRLRVAYTVCTELSRMGRADNLNTRLQRIGWRINGQGLVPANESVRELFFRKDSQYDAYVCIRSIICCAQKSLRIVDSYLDRTVFTILGNVHHPLTIELLTSRPPADFALEATKFQKQHPGMHIEIRESGDFTTAS